MVNQPSAALKAAMKRDKSTTSEDRLEKVRDMLRDARDTEYRIVQLEATLKEQKERINQLKHKDLPDLFDEVNIDNLGLPAEGNLPAYDCKLGPYYKASIPADWEEDKRKKAFDYLDTHDAGSLIKSTYIVLLPRGKRAIALKVQKVLEKLGVEFSEKLDVPWNTLTAWLKESVEKRNTTPDLDIIGGTVGRVVQLKERKNG